MNKEYCFDCQNVFDAQQGHHCVHGWRIPKTLYSKDAYFSTKVQNNDYESQLTFPLLKEESSFPISFINELGNAELAFSAQTDITYLLINNDNQLPQSSECSSEEMKHQFMISNSMETCLGDGANRETDVEAKISKHPVHRIGDNLIPLSNICNSRMLVENCETNVVRSEFSKFENSSKLNNENNNRDFIMSSMDIDSLMLNKTESEYSSKGHQQKSNVKMDNLLSKNIHALSDERKLNTNIESNIIPHNNEVVSKVVQLSERSRQFSVSRHNLHDIVQEFDLENKSCPININENLINQQINSNKIFTLEVTKDCTFNGCLASQENVLTFGNQIYQGDEKQVAPQEILNSIITESKRSYADAIAAVIGPSCSLNSEHTCPICLKEFRTMQILKQHNETDSGLTRFTCRICQQKFTTKCSLNGHERKIHMSKKNYKCDDCGKLFTKKYALLVHFRTHTGEKPYKCDICKWAFAQNQNLKHHIKRWHNST